MLLKCSNLDRKMLISLKGGGNSNTGVGRGTAMKMTVATSSTMTPRIHRKGFRTPSKRHPGKVLPGKFHSVSRIGPGKIVSGKRINLRPHPPPCDNSNDSGLGFDQHVEIQSSSTNSHNNNNMFSHQQEQSQIIRAISTSRCDDNDGIVHVDDNDNDFINITHLRTKRKKIDNTSNNIQIDNDDACSNDAFIQKVATTISAITIPSSVSSLATAGELYSTSKFLSATSRGNVRAGLKRPNVPVQSNVTTSSKDSSIQLQIISQPEQQHRARYQTEGSRGAVKDRSGNSFPIVKLVGYNKSAVLQVFIGTDIGRVAPHMFYQACKVAGKNSTPCNEKKVDGTMIIEIEFKPENDMTITCDCVGILKERNVDVEHRFPDHSGQRNKKKSTRCRMVFRTQLTHSDGSTETLQVCSYPIICTQPPGVPEICKKSLSSCPVDGGLELFIIGKNFLKDTCIVFRDASETSDEDPTTIQPTGWEQTVYPDKEYLQQTHLICTVPPYFHQNIIQPVTVHLFIISGNKCSESHVFVYTPKGAHDILSTSTQLSTLHSTLNSNQDTRYSSETNVTTPTPVVLWGTNNINSKNGIDSGMMPPPSSLPIGIVRRSSISSNAAPIINNVAPIITNQNVVNVQNVNSSGHLSLGLKTEIVDENSQSSTQETIQTNTMDQFSQNLQNENVAAVVAAAVATTNQRIVKQNINLMDIHSMSILNDANNISNFPTTTTTSRSVVDMHANVIKQDQLNSQLQSQILNVASAAQQVVQDQQNVHNNSNTNSLFINTSNTNSNGIFSQTPPIPNINIISSNSTHTTLEQTFSHNILSGGNASTNLNQIVTMPQNDSSSQTSSNSSSPVTNIHSPITQNIILNSEQAASIQSASLQLLQPQVNDTSSTKHITSDLILNTTVSPSLICQTNSDSNSLMVDQVTMTNNILSEIDIATATPQNSQENLINNIMLNHSSVDQINISSHKATDSNVNNIMFKAATDFINDQERTLSTENTLNALMSLNTNTILNSISSNSSQTTSNSSPMHKRNDLTLQQHQSTQSNLKQLIHSSSSQSSQQSTISQQLSHFNEPTVISSQQLPTDRNINSITSTSLGNLIISENINTSSNQNGFLHNQLQKTSTMSSSGKQESLLQQTIPLEERENLEKSKIGRSGNSTQTTTTIPQEITTMSDQDLISYINPSTFDQV